MTDKKIDWRVKEKARVLVNELDQLLRQSDYDEAERVIARALSEPQRVGASDVDPTAGLNPDFNWGGDA